MFTEAPAVEEAAAEAAEEEAAVEESPKEAEVAEEVAAPMETEEEEKTEEVDISTLVAVAEKMRPSRKRAQVGLKIYSNENMQNIIFFFSGKPRWAAESECITSKEAEESPIKKTTKIRTHG